MKIAPNWKLLFEKDKIFETSEMLSLKSKIQKEQEAYTVYPANENIFRVFQEVDFDKIKVVIIGQDPYHGPNQANGMAFAVNAEIPRPPSLANIFKEIEKEFGQMPEDKTLLSWAAKGVFLLNTSLTVRANEANSHNEMGWGFFTDYVVRKLNEREKPICFLLWGSHAQSKKGFITNPNHKVLCAAHPSPLSAHKGFFGCNHFKQAEEFLVIQNLWI